MTASELASALAEVLEAELGAVTVENLTRVTAGANRETWSFDAATLGARHELILQRDRESADRSAGGCAREALVLRAAGARGAPVAQVVTTDGPGTALVRSFTINRRITGETIARRILRDDAWQHARDRLVTDCANALARIHQIMPNDMDGTDLEAVPDALGRLFAVYAAMDDPHPSFELGFRWLERHRPEPLPQCLIHGDFRLGNLLFDQTGLAAALDWELAHYGDPGEDLGWLCVRAWRFGGKEPVAGVGSYDDLLSAYRYASGLDVAPETLRWWETYGTLRWGVICLQLGGEFRAGRSHSMELATVGRRVVENEHDLLGLIQ